MKSVVLETRNGEAAVLVNDGTVRIVRGVYNVGKSLITGSGRDSSSGSQLPRQC